MVRFLPGNRELRDGAQRSWAVLGSPWSLTPGVAALEWEAFNISSSQIGHLLRIQNSHILDELDPANLWVPNIKPKQLNTFSRHFAAQFHLCVFFWGLCGHFYCGVRLEALCVAWELLGCRPSGVWNSRGNLGMSPGWEGRLTNDVQNMVKSDKKQDAAGLFLMVCDVCGFCTVEVWLSSLLMPHKTNATQQVFVILTIWNHAILGATQSLRPFLVVLQNSSHPSWMGTKTHHCGSIGAPCLRGSEWSHCWHQVYELVLGFTGLIG